MNHNVDKTRLQIKDFTLDKTLKIIDKTEENIINNTLDMTLDNTIHRTYDNIILRVLIWIKIQIRLRQ